MNFLFVLDYFTPSKWWVEKVFETIVFDLAKKWHNIKVLTSHFDKKLPKYEKIDNVEIYRIWKNRLYFTILAPFLGLKLLKNIDIIHTSTYNAAYVTKFLSFFTRVKVILTSHEILWQMWYKFKWKKWWFYKKFEDLIYSFGFYYVFVANHVKNVALTSYNLDLSKIKTIYNGIWEIKIKNSLTKQDLWFEKDDIVGIFAWRPGWTKGLDFLLENYDDIVKLNPDFKLLLLILEKNNKKKIDYILWKIKNKNNIKILFEVEHDKVYEYINLADIWIVTSRTEWFGLSALEYCKMWKKCVFSFVWAIPEISFGDIHFFKPDNKEQFLQAFKEIFNWKINDYSYDKILTDEKMVKEYERLY